MLKETIIFQNKELDPSLDKLGEVNNIQKNLETKLLIMQEINQEKQKLYLS